MPKRTFSQRKGDSAEGYVRRLFDDHPRWLARAQSHDFGVDLEAELANFQADEQFLTGKLLKIQVKGGENWKRSNGSVSTTLPREYLDYIAQFRLPVILVVVDTSSGEAWWLWLQEWLLRNEARLVTSTATTVTVTTPLHQRVVEGMDGPLASIASGENPTSLIIALRELATTARSANNIEIVQTIFDLLDKVEAPSREWALEKTIDSLIGLGTNVGFWQTQQFVPQLLAIVERIGPSLNAEQIMRLVVRGETYSRAALYALSKLYDVWPDHTQALKLPEKFRGAGIDAVAWYCDLREAYPELRSFDLWRALGGGKLFRLEFGGLKLFDDTNTRDRISMSWPNRGDSIFLDFLVSANRPAEQQVAPGTDPK